MCDGTLRLGPGRGSSLYSKRVGQEIKLVQAPCQLPVCLTMTLPKFKGSHISVMEQGPILGEGRHLMELKDAGSGWWLSADGRS